MMLGDTKGSEGVRIIGGLLMVHLVISGAQELYSSLLHAEGLKDMVAILIG